MNWGGGGRAVMTIRKLHEEDLCGFETVSCLDCGSSYKKFTVDKMTEL